MEQTSEKLLESDNDVAIVGNCANCGVEYHIHITSHIANLKNEVSELTKQYHFDASEIKRLEAKNKELREALKKIVKIDAEERQATNTIMQSTFKGYEHSVPSWLKIAEQALKEDKQDG